MFYKKLVQYIIVGHDIDLLKSFQSQEDFVSFLADWKLQSKENNESINILINNEIINVKLENDYADVTTNVKLRDYISAVKLKDNNFVFALKKKMQVARISRNFFIFTNTLVDLNVIFRDEFSSEVIKLTGKGMRLDFFKPLDVVLSLTSDSIETLKRLQRFDDKDFVYLGPNTFTIEKENEIHFDEIEDISDSSKLLDFNYEGKSLGIELRSRSVVDDDIITENADLENKLTQESLNEVEKLNESLDVEGSIFDVFNFEKVKFNKVKKVIK